MAFTIDDNIPPLVYGLGETFSFQPAMATGSTPAPSGWTATGLPAGFAINATTGKITGAATEVGVFDCVATATGSGPVTDTVSFQIGITDRVGYDAILGPVIEINMDLRTGFVSVVNTTPGVAEEGAVGALLYSKRGDKPVFALGLVKDGELQDLIVTDVKLSLKGAETDEDPVLTTNGTFWKTGAYQATRYVFPANLSGDALDELLEEEEDEEGTFADLLAEIQVVYAWYPPGVSPDDDPEPTPQEGIRTSQDWRYRIARDWIDE